MKKKTIVGLMIVAFLAAGFPAHTLVWGIGRGGGGGGRGGGGGFGGGGGGGRVGGGGGNFGGGGGGRPSVGSAPALSRPSGGGGGRPNAGGGNRPQIQPGNRPQIQPGNRPQTGGGNRPQIQPGGRPEIGGGNRPSTLPANRPGGGQGIGGGQAGNRPGSGGSTTRLPGLGDGGAGSRLPNQGAGVKDRMANRPQTQEDRRSQLNDKLTSGREDRQGNRQDNQQDRQDWRDQNREDRQNWRDQNREDWQNFAQDNRYNHGFYNGCWHGNWYPGAGWGYMWSNYPGAAAFGLTMWGINRMAYGFGYWGYSNPYAGGGGGGYDYSQPIVTYDEAQAPSQGDGGAPAAGPSDPDSVGMQAFEAGRSAFYEGNYQAALNSMDTALKTMPNDAVVHEFRSLILFAMGRYPEAAAGVYAVLSSGPGWDWTTLSSAYPDVEIYTKQLRALEDFTKTNPNSSDGHFLLAYHYLTCNYAENAAKELKAAQAQLPNDKLINRLLGSLTPPKAGEETPSPAPEVQATGPAITAKQLQGRWKAESMGAQYDLTLNENGTFIWKYVQGKSSQVVRGVFAVDQVTLAMEPDSGGTMLAKITLNDPTHLNFLMVGGEPGDPGLNFTKSP